VVAATGPTDSTPQGPRHRRFAKLGACRQNFSGDTYQEGHCSKHYHYKQATWQKNGGKSFGKKKFGSLHCQEPVNHNTITEVKSKSTNNGTTLRIIGITQRGGKATAGRKVYVSLGPPSNRSATARAASSTPSLAASIDPSTGPYTTDSREMLGSRLRKHISTWSATACARARPSSPRRLPIASSSWDIFLLAESRRGSTTLASGVTSPLQIGLKPKDARAASAWPRKLQTCYPLLAREAWRSSSPLWAMTSSYICRSASCCSRTASLASWSLSPVSWASASS
jgi:hypothetical protein